MRLIKAIDPQPGKHMAEWFRDDPTGAAAFMSIFWERPKDLPQEAKATCDENSVWFWAEVES